VKGGDTLGKEQAEKGRFEASAETVLIQGRRADCIIFDDVQPDLPLQPYQRNVLERLTKDLEPFWFRQYYKEEDTMSGVMHVEGHDIYELRAKLGNEHHPWISIEPVIEHVAGPVPTEKFVVRWHGFRERYDHQPEMFVRQVNSVKELNEVLQPIFQAQKRRSDGHVKERNKSEQKRIKEEIKNLVDSRDALITRARELDDKIDECRGDLRNAR
jgi:hypothetical protein